MTVPCEEVAHCPACGEVMTPENSRPSIHPIAGRHPSVCKDDHACFERYYLRRDRWRR